MRVIICERCLVLFADDGQYYQECPNCGEKWNSKDRNRVSLVEEYTNYND